jgi:Novel STAND NTPase 1/Domain of unknown function (DUF4062)
MYKVFLSSTSRDLTAYREAVHRAIDQLDGFDLVKMEDFGARDDTPRELCARRVGESDVLVGLLGHYYGSCPPGEELSFTELEYREAVDRSLSRVMFFAPDDFLSPISLREPDDSFRRQQAFRARVMAERVGASFASPEQLASAVTTALANWRQDRERAPAPTEAIEKPLEPLPLGANPYRGLEAFRKQDAERFFGREALVDKLWQQFLALHKAPADGKAPMRLLAILGASGSGKSSVAQAGLLAELDQRPLPGRPKPPSVVVTPEARPLESLAVALARLATGEESPAQKAQEFERVLREREGFDGLRYLAAHMLGVERAGVILLVDQFEEVFSLCDDEKDRATFIGNLLQAAREPGGRVSIILTLRSDFLGAINRDAELSRLIAAQNVVVPGMGVDELRMAIEEPAKHAGHEIDPATAQLLVEQTLGREGALPLLEFVLTRIWDGFRDGIAAAETVQQLGGVGGALANEAEAVFASLSKEDQAIARRAFLSMVRLGEGTGYTGRRVSIDEIVTDGESRERVLKVISALAAPGRRLVTLGSTEAGEPTAEVAHEALFDHWRSLRNWLNDDRDNLRFRRRLYDDAREWDKDGRPSGLLWRSPKLDGVPKDYLDRGHISIVESAFLQASQSLRKRLKGQKRGLRLRIAVIFLAIEATFVAGVFYGTGQKSADLWNQAKRTENVMIRLLSDLSRAALLTDEFAELQTFIENDGRIPRIRAVVVSDVDGRVVAASDAALIGKPLPALSDGPHTNWRAVEVRGRANHLGALAIEFSDLPIENAFNEILTLGIGIAVAGMVLIALVGLAMGFVLTRRLADE